MATPAIAAVVGRDVATKPPYLVSYSVVFAPGGAPTRLELTKDVAETHPGLVEHVRRYDNENGVRRIPERVLQKGFSVFFVFVTVWCGLVRFGAVWCGLVQFCAAPPTRHALF